MYKKSHDLSEIYIPNMIYKKYPYFINPKEVNTCSSRKSTNFRSYNSSDIFVQTVNQKKFLYVLLCKKRMKSIILRYLYLVCKITYYLFAITPTKLYLSATHLLLYTNLVVNWPH
jgi:hypothetical protein